MTIVTGKFNSKFKGIVKATPSHIFFNQKETPPIIIALPIEANIIDGAFEIEIPQSQNLSLANTPTEGITYKFELLKELIEERFYLADGNQFVGARNQDTTGWWTGVTKTPESKKLDRVVTANMVTFQEAMYFVIPEKKSVDLTELIGVPVQTPYLDITLYRLADLLTNNNLYREKISSKFVLKGTYKSTEVYNFNDVVSFNGSSYICISSTPITSVNPDSDINQTQWMVLAAKGNSGGTGAVIVGYDPNTWENNTEASARGDVSQAIEDIKKMIPEKLDSSSLAPIQNPSFSGFVKRNVMTYPVSDQEKPTEIVTAQYVENALNDQKGSFPKPFIFVRRVKTLPINKDTTTQIIWDNRVEGLNFVQLNGNIIIPDDGNYLFFLKLILQIHGSFGANNQRTEYKATLFLNNSEKAIFFQENTSSTAQVTIQNREGWSYQRDLKKGAIVQIRFFLTGDGIFNSNHAISPGADNENNYLLSWKI